MAGRRQIQRECDRLNAVRNVRQVGSLSCRDFWEQAPGSFLIAGGSDVTRTDALCDRLFRDMAYQAGPTFVLTAAGNTEQEMIRRCNEGAPGLLRLSSARYRNYHFFYGWTAADIIWFLTQAADLVGYSSPEMPIYIHAFIEILSRCYPPSLAAILALARLTDAQVVQVGQRYGAPSLAMEQITHYAAAGAVFRLVLDQVRDVFSVLTTDDCATGYNLSSVRGSSDGTYIVNLSSKNPEMMAIYFARELRRATLGAWKPRIVISDMLLQDGPLRTALKEAQDAGAEIGISLKDAAGVVRDQPLLFQSRIILLDDAISDGDLQTLLEPLGTYTHYEPMVEGGRPPKLFAILTDERWRPNPEPGRLRVRPVDTAGYQAVAQGSRGNQILLVRALR